MSSLESLLAGGSIAEFGIRIVASFDSVARVLTSASLTTVEWSTFDIGIGIGIGCGIDVGTVDGLVGVEVAVAVVVAAFADSRGVDDSDDDDEDGLLRRFFIFFCPIGTEPVNILRGTSGTSE